MTLNQNAIPDQAGRTIIITGASSGIGLAAARELARAGGRVVLAVRDAAKGDRAAATIEGTTEVLPLDLADLTSVYRFATDWNRPVDVLINNAGVANGPLRRTKDGFELQFGTNHLGHFALTLMLLPLISERVVTVASNAHKAATIDMADLNWQTRRYKHWAAYGQSKLANLLFTLELQRRLDAAGSPVRALAAHPGAASTDLGRDLSPAMKLVLAAAARLIFQTPEAGALPLLHAATRDVPGGSYIGPDGRRELRGQPKLVEPSDRAKDPALARGLWLESERLTGVRFGAASEERKAS
jgi:NAD(P)-dependent dehydrogenase (short-subunit alcohol dehydrogenase family)